MPRLGELVRDLGVLNERLGCLALLAKHAERESLLPEDDFTRVNAS
jgi:hypothetical protein